MAPLCEKYDVIHKTGSAQLIALLSEEDRATSTGNMYGKFGDIWTVVLRDASGLTGIKTH